MGTYLKNNFYLVIVLLALTFSYLLITFTAFPYLGIAVTLSILSTFVYIRKQERSNIDTLLYVCTLIFSFCIIWRANAFLTFLNILAVLYSGSLLSFNTKEKEGLGFVNLALSPLRLILTSLQTRNSIHLETNKGIATPGITKSSDTTKAVIITFMLLAVIIPLLASANPIFERLITNVLNVFNIETIIRRIFTQVTVFRTVAFLVLLFILPKFFSFIKSKKDGLQVPFSLASTFSLVIPKAAVSFVLVLFFFTQAQLYFSDIETLRALDLTYSQYAREIFAQLTIVAGIIIGLLYNDRNRLRWPEPRSTWNKMLTYTLLIEGIFLTIMAFKSVNDYSNQWGFTEKRLWGYTGVIWMFAVFAAYLYSYLKEISLSRFVQSVLAITIVTLLTVNIANFDYLIYNYRKSVTERGVDHVYLTRLSEDSHSYREELDHVMVSIEKQYSSDDMYYQAGIPFENATWNISRLRMKYNELDWRTFNISQYQEYLDVKDIHTDEYRKKWKSLSPDNQLYPEQSRVY